MSLHLTWNSIMASSQGFQFFTYSHSTNRCFPKPRRIATIVLYYILSACEGNMPTVVPTIPHCATISLLSLFYIQPHA